MRLKVYLATMDMSVKEFSKKIGCSSHYLSRIVNGFKPGKRLAQDIERETGGQVKVEYSVKKIAGSK